MNAITSYLDSVANAVAKVGGAINPPKTVVQAPAAQPNGNGKTPIWVWVIGGLGVVALIAVLANFARKA